MGFKSFLILTAIVFIGILTFIVFEKNFDAGSGPSGGWICQDGEWEKYGVVGGLIPVEQCD